MTSTSTREERSARRRAREGGRLARTLSQHGWRGSSISFGPDCSDSMAIGRSAKALAAALADAFAEGTHFILYVRKAHLVEHWLRIFPCEEDPADMIVDFSCTPPTSHLEEAIDAFIDS